MDLDDGAGSRHGFKLDAHDLFALHMLEDPVEDAGFRPPVHPGVDGVPIAKSCRYPSPFATMLGDIQNGVEHLAIGEAAMAALHREMRRDTVVLSLSEFHTPRIP